MLEILSITGPIYLTLAVGWAATRFGLFAAQDMRVLGRFVLNLALPALLFSAISQRRLADIFNPTYLVVYAAGSLATLTLGYLWTRRAAGRGRAESAIAAMGMCSSNSGYVGYPILLLTMPGLAVVAVALNMIVENLIVLPTLFVMADRDRHAHLAWRPLVAASALRLARNPMLLAMAAGVLVSLSGLQVPQVVTRAVAMFASASVAVSLFVVGGVLAGVTFRGAARDAATVMAGKLFLHPLLVFAAAMAAPLLGLPPLPPALFAAAVLLAAMPMLGIYTILAQPYDQEARSAAALLLTTVVSFFTLSALLWLLKGKGLLG